MKPTLLRYALILSLLANVGVVAAVAWHRLAGGEPAIATAAPNLPAYLDLDAAQRRQWHASEAPFLTSLAAGAEAARGHRDRLIAAIFAEPPDLAGIEAEQAAIARLQETQQKLVVAQLLHERELLTATQRARLAALLTAQPVGPTTFERLHRD